MGGVREGGAESFAESFAARDGPTGVPGQWQACMLEQVEGACRCGRFWGGWTSARKGKSELQPAGEGRDQAGLADC